MRADATIRIDAADLERRLGRIRRDQERDPKKSYAKLAMGRQFIEAMEKSGLLPRGTTYVRITAAIDEPLRLDYETYGDEELVEVAAAMTEAETHEEAKVQ